MFYLQSGNYLVTMNRFDSQSGWSELLIDEYSFSRQPVIGGLHRFQTVGSVWFSFKGSVCFYFSEEFFDGDSTILVMDVLRELYRNGIKDLYVAYDTFPPTSGNLIRSLDSKTYQGVPLHFKK